MCGILGFIGPRDFGAEPFERALDLMAARGPDDRGIYEGPEVLLGHRRLAIIDLSPGGHQPMASADGRYQIVFNGEIYNYREIRSRLEREGVAFRSQSDTEVILAAYALNPQSFILNPQSSSGPACLNDLRGMFAFAIYDRLEQSVFLARDRMGIKPLYVWRTPRTIAFASEVKALRALPGAPSEIDVLALWDYLLWGSVAEPRTITEGIECLPPATWLKWTAGSETRRTYWQFPTGGPVFARRGEAIEALRPVLRESVALRCIADVPVGAFLSGGIDSSSVVSLMRAAGQSDLRTFSISFPQTDLDEAPYALKVAEEFHTRHSDISCTSDMVMAELDGFFAAMDQPTSDGLNTYLVSHFARAGGITVALSGLGGDELFAGYPSFRRIVRTHPFFSALPAPAVRAIGRVGPYFMGKSKKIEALAQPASVTDALYYAARGLFMPSQAQALLSDDVLAEIVRRRDALEDGDRGSEVGGRKSDICPPPSVLRPLSSVLRLPSSANGHSVLHQVMQLELRRYMHNQLLRDSDVFGLAHGLEIRVPLIDHVLAETLFRTHPAMILHGAAKSLLLDALPGPLPRLCTHRPKMGFTFPFDRWMRSTWRSTIESTLLAPPSMNARNDIFSHTAAAHLWRDYLAGQVHWSRPWAVYVAMRQLQSAVSVGPPQGTIRTAEASFDSLSRQERKGGTIFLLPEGFHSFGGIQKYNRDQVQAVRTCEPTKPLSLFVLNDSQDEVEQPEWAGCMRRGYSRSKLRFALGALRQAWHQRPARVVFGHRNFLPLVPLMRLASLRTEQWLLVYGIEASSAVSPVESGFLRGIDRLFAISPQTGATIQEAGCKNEIELWPCSLPFTWQLPTPSPPRFQEPYQLLSVARLAATERYKGIDETIRALRLIVNEGVRAELHVAGAGQDLERLLKITHDLGLDKMVHFHGRVSDATLRAMYSACDLFVLPSGGEGFGIVYLEAMAYAKPVIAADAGAAPFVVRPGESGFLVPFGDAAALARCILERLRDPEGSRTTGLRGRNFLMRQFSFECFEARTREILLQDADRKRVPSSMADHDRIRLSGLDQ